MLVSEFMVNPELKNTQWDFFGFMECLNEGAKKKELFLYIGSRAIQITTGANDDLIEINN